MTNRQRKQPWLERFGSGKLSRCLLATVTAAPFAGGCAGKLNRPVPVAVITPRTTPIGHPTSRVAESKPARVQPSAPVRPAADTLAQVGFADGAEERSVFDSGLIESEVETVSGATFVEDTAGEDTAGEDTAGEDTAGEDTAGGDSASNDSGSIERVDPDSSGSPSRLASLPRPITLPDPDTVAPGSQADSVSGALPTIQSGKDSVTFDERDAGDVTRIDLNLPSTLAMVGGQHPAVGLARWRVQEAYAELARTKALWLPSIQGGFSFHRHDGNYQASNGDIVDVNRNSFQYGLGMGATGAGTTQRPGLIAQFHFADAIFQPKVARATAWARGHAAGATLNRQLLDAATAYVDLLDAHQNAAIVRQSVDRIRSLSKITSDFAEAGEGLQADADRLQTEAILMESRMLEAEEQIDIASARLAQTISLDGGGKIVPMDVVAVPLDLVPPAEDKGSENVGSENVSSENVGSLVGIGLANRPELKESKALVAAACEAYDRERYAPFVPSVLLGFSTGGFGGGLGNELDNVEGRYDFDAQMAWRLRNLGFGEHAARRQAASRVQQAKFEVVAVMDQVAREVVESVAQVDIRRRQIEVSRRAIQSAEDSYRRNSERIRDGQGLPIEVLQSEQALLAASQAYLAAVSQYNRAQFRLQWALGWPVDALENTQTAAVSVPPNRPAAEQQTEGS
jgi:outer membrane protein TolC